MNNDLIKKRLSKTYRIGKVLARLPYVRCLLLNGSLAQGKSNKNSDIDIMIIAKFGHIFTARFFVNLFGTIFRFKRSKDHTKSYAGKFCFNYFIADDYLKIPTGRGEKIDKYCADSYSHSVFIAGDKNLYEKFIEVNEELFILYGRHHEPMPTGRQIVSRSQRIKRSRNKFGITFYFQDISEIIFNNWFEKWARKYQIKKIESDSRTKKYPTLIVYNDRELRFHPPKS